MSLVFQFFIRNRWLIIVPIALMILAYVNFFVINDQNYNPLVLVMPVIIGLILGGLIQTITKQKETLDALNTTLMQSNAALYEQQAETRLAMMRMQKLQGSALMALGAVHDIRNILTPVVMGADLIKPPNEDDQLLLQDMKITAERGVELTNKILNALNNSTHQLNPHPAHTLLPKIWKRTQSVLPKPIVAQFDLQESMICVDPDDLMQIIHNLSLNAYKAIGEGVLLKIEGQIVDQHYAIHISDNGSGIPQEIIQRISTLNLQTVNGSTHGLGLAIVAHMVEQNKGVLTFDSQPTGTKISLTFPTERQIE